MRPLCCAVRGSILAVMGDSGQRRSTLVSKLPIFRRSIGRKQDSLPSSPSSNNTGGLHSSSPSSTNSSSGSTGKRRSIFRTPSLSFHYKKENEQKCDSTCQTAKISNGAQTTSHNSSHKLDLEEPIKTKEKGSIGVPSSCKKKITRSQTEDFEKRKDHSSNKNVFTNCLGKSEPDDSGFADEYSKHSVKHSTRKLLPRSFSTHYRFSKPVSQCQSASVRQNSVCSQDMKTTCPESSSLVKPVLPIASEIYDYTEASLDSPQFSTDHTTAPQTPSEFVFMDDSASEADSLPNSGKQQPHKQHFCRTVSTSQTSPCSVSRVTRANEDTAFVEVTSRCNGTSITKDQEKTLVERTGSSTSLVCSSGFPTKALLPISELSTKDCPSTHNGTALQPGNTGVFQNGEHSHSTECFPKKYKSATDQYEVKNERPTTYRSISESKGISSPEPHMSLMQHSLARVNYASSFSPFRDGRYSERRLRSSSEGTAGSSSMMYKPKEGNREEMNSLRKQRTISTSSKMNSMATDSLWFFNAPYNNPARRESVAALWKQDDQPESTRCSIKGPAVPKQSPNKQ
uniref:Coiled-coil serine rich protein 1 n=1 Tax=Leptobrachium leishanense TaxID=445787 RepID=A0A8C5P8X4_9ANUR